jgi:hypothetical protein
MADSFAQFQKQFRNMQSTVPPLQQSASIPNQYDSASRAYTPGTQAPHGTPMNGPVNQSGYTSHPPPMNMMNTMPMPMARQIQDQATGMKQYEELNARYGSVDKASFVPPKILLYNRKTYAFDPANLIFGQPRKHPKGSSVCDVSYHLVCPEEKIDTIVTPVYIELPPAASVFGLNESKYNPDRWTIDISLDDPANYSIFQAMFLWDQRIVEMASGKAAELFGDPRITSASIAEMYNFMSKLKYVKDTNTWYTPRLSLKVPSKNGKLDVVVYDDNRHLTSQKVVGTATGRKYIFTTSDGSELEIGRKAQVRIIFKLGGLWFTHKSFTMSNPICQIQILPRPQALDGFAFSGQDDDEAPTTPPVLEIEPQFSM